MLEGTLPTLTLTCVQVDMEEAKHPAGSRLVSGHLAMPTEVRCLQRLRREVAELTGLQNCGPWAPAALPCVWGVQPAVVEGSPLPADTARTPVTMGTHPHLPYERCVAVHPNRRYRLHATDEGQEATEVNLSTKERKRKK